MASREPAQDVLEHPTPEMIEAGVHMHQTPRTGPPETLVYDIWQSMYDARPEAAPAVNDLRARVEDIFRTDIAFRPGPQDIGY